MAVMRRAGALLAILAMLLQAPAGSGTYPDLGDFKKGFKSNVQRCANAHRVQLLQVMALMEAPIAAGYDRNSKCFIYCLMDKYEMVTPDGEFMDGKIRRFAVDLPDSNFKMIMKKNLDSCLREGGSERRQKTKEASAIHAVDRLMNNEDICEKCYQFAKCYYDRAKVRNGNQKQPYQRLTNYYEGSSDKLFNKVGSWARNQWNQPSNGPRGI
ncbi:uncharacterized protein LOC117643606 isoform X1 [Thrips palmi]|uniref:Uncharacterized protein LOC117643606 isoform X1 n=1 Tax=Thrips palmi TaxID=161013 RepID=A0A6P8YFI3_THRPL|nr:uncharacterized protein LOC117643606 isoform X1 [Thrips palmi]